MKLGRMDPYYGAREREWAGTQLARVTGVDADTGRLSVNYMTCPGGDSGVMFTGVGAFTQSYGIFCLPLVGSWVEVIQVGDKSRIARPYMGFMKHFKGTDSPSTLDSEAGRTMQPMVPGEIYIDSDFGSYVRLVESGAVVLKDSGVGTFYMDPSRDGFFLSSPGTIKSVGYTGVMRFGTVQRNQATLDGVIEKTVMSPVGMTPYQEFRTTVYPSQVSGSNLSSLNLQFGDIVSDSAVPTQNPLLIGLVEYKNLLGASITKLEINRSGGYSIDMGLAGQISNSYDALLGSVSEACLGPRTIDAPTVGINSGSVTHTVAPDGASVRVGDFTLSNASVDPTIWSFFSSLSSAIAAIPVTAGDGGATFKSGLAALFSSMPTSITSKITTGSLTVKVGG